MVALADIPILFLFMLWGGITAGLFFHICNGLGYAVFNPCYKWHQKVEWGMVLALAPTLLFCLFFFGGSFKWW